MGLIRINSYQHWWAYNTETDLEWRIIWSGHGGTAATSAGILFRVMRILFQKDFRWVTKFWFRRGRFDCVIWSFIFLFSLKIDNYFYFCCRIKFNNVQRGSASPNRSAHSCRCLLRWLWGIVGLDIQTSFRGIPEV